MSTAALPSDADNIATFQGTTSVPPVWVGKGGTWPGPAADIVKEQAAKKANSSSTEQAKPGVWAGKGTIWQAPAADIVKEQAADDASKSG